jgi:putative ABC transport system permease protein
LIPIRYSARNLSQRFTASLMTGMSVALVVMVLTILLGFVNGMRRTLTSAVDANNFIVLQRGVSVEAGGMGHATLDILRTRPEIAADQEGRPLFSPEIVLGFDPTPDASHASVATLRAVTQSAFQVHRNLQVVEGHKAQRGKNQWVVGQRLAAQYPNLRPGATFNLFHTQWHIAGIFADGGSARESEVWTDLDDLAVALHVSRDQWGATSVHLGLKPGNAESLRHLFSTDTRLRVDLLSEQDFYAQAAIGFTGQLRQLGLIVAMSLSVGAVFGGMNTMYAAVSRRKREIGTLRALGFGRANVMFAFIVESALLGFAGGIVGQIFATVVAFTTGLESRLMSVGTILFSFNLSWTAFAAGSVVAILIGIGGGALPAWQASRLDLLDSLRD